MVGLIEELFLVSRRGLKRIQGMLGCLRRPASIACSTCRRARAAVGVWPTSRFKRSVLADGRRREGPLTVERRVERYSYR